MTEGNEAGVLDLAERCEQATEPSRELDVAIHTAVTSFEPRVGGVGWPKGALVVPAFPGWVPLPAYSASLDAAMTLVPEGWYVSGISEFNQRTWSATLRTGYPEHAFASSQVARKDTGCASAALALCAAALRARAQTQSDEGMQ